MPGLLEKESVENVKLAGFHYEIQKVACSVLCIVCLYSFSYLMKKMLPTPSAVHCWPRLAG